MLFSYDLRHTAGHIDAALLLLDQFLSFLMVSDEGGRRRGETMASGYHFQLDCQPDHPLLP